MPTVNPKKVRAWMVINVNPFVMSQRVSYYSQVSDNIFRQKTALLRRGAWSIRRYNEAFNLPNKPKQAEGWIHWFVKLNIEFLNKKLCKAAQVQSGMKISSPFVAPTKGYVVTAKLAVLPLWSRRWSLIQQTGAPAQRKPSPWEMGYQGRQKRCAHWPVEKRRWTPLCYSLNQKMSLSHLRISLTVEGSEVVPPENSKKSD